ncbi:MAG: LysM peptidoglycan-binding domain-containing protein [Candidatus Thiothrix putei]|uniref:LysM peptidoglycan-binding domain-containing protein n=1 Tax=Candidatus Thiothrix putei TaxID=3080811 RepID=A0AA95HCT3_9GAMM|nr:MAG: LysM peptidoglycan-binding domain-containing protein [Candidatus Thiothrix putei]
MDRKIKVVAATSLLALMAAACTPNPYYAGTGYNNGSNTQTNTVNRAAVSHTHCGRTHTHVLPAEGLAHHHGDGCLAGSGGAATTTTANTSNYNYGYTAPVTTPTPQQPAINYGYTAPATTPYYDYSASTASSSSYYDYSAPKATTPANSNTYRATPTPTPAAPAASVVNSGSYVVQKGDTVFQVMRNTGVYWKDIIRLNNLVAPNYTIAPGQRLKLK